MLVESHCAPGVCSLQWPVAPDCDFWSMLSLLRGGVCEKLHQTSHQENVVFLEPSPFLRAGLGALHSELSEDSATAHTDSPEPYSAGFLAGVN